MEYRPEGMNIEVTTKCPFNCPQCYCSLSGGKDIPLLRAKEILTDAAKLGIKHVELSGGETMCYSQIYELIEYAAHLGIEPNIAVSGWGITDETIEKLVRAGVSTIFVSLNAPDEKRNKMSREGYEYSIRALEALNRNKFPETYINWVMHRSTAECFDEMLKLAEELNVKGILIIEPKPNSEGNYNPYPSLDQMEQIVRKIKEYRGPVEILVQHCFSSLKILLGRSALLGNKNVGKYKGCTAGAVSMCVNVDGHFTPCRHLDYSENWQSPTDYWNHSPLLNNIRAMRNTKNGKCSKCSYSRYCRPCPSFNIKQSNILSFSNEQCPLWAE